MSFLNASDFDVDDNGDYGRKQPATKSLSSSMNSGKYSNYDSRPTSSMTYGKEDFYHFGANICVTSISARFARDPYVHRSAMQRKSVYPYTLFNSYPNILRISTFDWSIRWWYVNGTG